MLRGERDLPAERWGELGADRERLGEESGEEGVATGTGEAERCGVPGGEEEYEFDVCLGDVRGTEDEEYKCLGEVMGTYECPCLGEVAGEVDGEELSDRAGEVPPPCCFGLVGETLLFGEHSGDDDDV